MNIENQVISLELAKKLKELGVKQDSLIWWIKGLNPKSHFSLAVYGGFSKHYHDEALSAFTASELADMLPNTITLNDPDMGPYNNFRIQITKHIIVPKTSSETLENIQPINVFSVNYEGTTTGQEKNWTFSSLFRPIFDINFANALAKVLIKIKDIK